MQASSTHLPGISVRITRARRPHPSALAALLQRGMRGRQLSMRGRQLSLVRALAPLQLLDARAQRIGHLAWQATDTLALRMQATSLQLAHDAHWAP
jgi:hypothetical protein